ncbi:hypothetical protein [Streptomyces hygroscopicus]|nr:hypothetical protein [Streptomyces hygroscopicus]
MEITSGTPDLPGIGNELSAYALTTARVETVSVPRHRLTYAPEG